MIRALAIDDEPLALKQLATYIRKVPYFELAGECPSAAEARKILDSAGADVIFVDINMPDLTGLDFVRSLAAPPLVVFTTAYSEYALEGYKVDAVDYLLKPFGLDEFLRAAEKVRERYELRRAGAGGETDRSIFLKADYKVVRVDPDKILYVESMSEYLKVFVEGEKAPIVVLLSMKKMEERLAKDHFMRVHRSWLVNLDKVREVSRGRIILEGGEVTIPIGDLYKDAFQAWLDQRFLGK